MSEQFTHRTRGATSERREQHDQHRLSNQQREQNEHHRSSERVTRSQRHAARWRRCGATRGRSPRAATAAYR